MKTTSDKRTGKELYEEKIKSSMSYSELGEKYGETMQAVRGRVRRYVDSVGGSVNNGGGKNNDEDGITVEISGDNKQIVSSKSSRITSLDELIVQCKINLDEWAVDHHTVNTWESAAKVNEELVAITLHQVKAWLERKNPIAIQPIIRPLIYKSTAEKPHSNKLDDGKSKIKRSLILSDPQFGFRRDIFAGELSTFHDRQCLDIALQIIRNNDFDEVILNGDIMDLPDWSDRFVRSPEFVHTTQHAIIEAHYWLSEIRKALPNAKIIAMKGNHEARMNNAIIKNLSAAYQVAAMASKVKFPVMSIPYLLGFESLDIQYIDEYPDGEYWINNNAKCVHGNIARGNPGATAVAQLKNSNATIIFAHIHRKEMLAKTIYERGGKRDVYAYCPGCLCKIENGPPGVKKKQNWQNGIGIIHSFSDGEHFIEDVPIFDGIAMFRGNLIAGEKRDDLDRVIKDALKDVVQTA